METEKRIGQQTRHIQVETGHKQNIPEQTKYAFPTRTGGKFLLEARPISTVPFMGSGQTIYTDVDIYSRYLIGLDTTERKASNSSAEISLDRTIPLTPCLAREIQNPDHYIPKFWVRGGMDTRGIIQNLDYSARCFAEESTDNYFTILPQQE